MRVFMYLSTLFRNFFKPKPTAWKNTTDTVLEQDFKKHIQQHGMDLLEQAEENITKQIDNIEEFIEDIFIPDYEYSEASLKKLSTCHVDLQRLCKELIKHRDVKILEGHRSKNRQNQLQKEGKSQLKWPNSRHNSYPSEAVDMVPYPIPDWENIEAFKEFMQFVKKTAKELGIEITCGGDWVSLRDYPHYELKRRK